jgi:hypothetical protein
MELENAIRKCVDCRIFDPENQPSVQKRLEDGWEPEVWTMLNGMTLRTNDGFSIPLSSDYVPCERHLAKLAAHE